MDVLNEVKVFKEVKPINKEVIKALYILFWIDYPQTPLLAENILTTYNMKKGCNMNV